MDETEHQMSSIIEEQRGKQLEIFKIEFINNLEVTNVYNNVKFFCENIQPFFYDRNDIFWFWNKEKFKWEIVDEIDLINIIGTTLKLKGQITNSGLINKYLHCFRQIGRDNQPEEPPKEWIQFKDKVFDIKTKEKFDVSHNYFFCNPIPYDIGTNSNTKILDKLFNEWVGEEYTRTLYEIIAYCCYRDYPIHIAVSLVGHGRNGKSSFLKILCKFLGQSNISSMDLEDLDPRNKFGASKAFKKLMISMGETNFNIMSATSKFKRITGQDLVSCEFKGKPSFDFYNYAKILIASNSLPTSTDTSEGFYRRWLIIDFPNEFPEGKDIIELIPEDEFSKLANRITNILPELLTSGRFTNQGTIIDRKNRYIMASNPLPTFIEECCERDVNTETKYSEFILNYTKYLTLQKRRIVSNREFRELLKLEGFEVDKLNRKSEKGDWQTSFYIFGLKIKDNWEAEINTRSSRSSRSLNLTIWTENQNDSNSENDGNDGNEFINKSNLLLQNDSKVIENKDLLLQESVKNIELNDVKERFTDKFLAFLEAEQSYESIAAFCRLCGFKEAQIASYIDFCKSQGLIFEIKPGFFRTL